MKISYEYKLSRRLYEALEHRNKMQYLDDLRTWAAIWAMIVGMCLFAFLKGI